MRSHVGHDDTIGRFVGFPRRIGFHVEHEKRRNVYVECLGVLKPHVGYANTRESSIGFPRRRGSHVEHKEIRSAYANYLRVLEPNIAGWGITP